MTRPVPGPYRPRPRRRRRARRHHRSCRACVSQDLDPVAVGASAHSLLLQPQGKLLVDFYALHVARRRVVVHVRGRVRRRARRRAEPVQDPGEGRGRGSLGRRALALRGRRRRRRRRSPRRRARSFAVDWPGAPGVRRRSARRSAIDGARARRSPTRRVRRRATRTKRARSRRACRARASTSTSARSRRRPYLERDAVSFTKGCFVGQELVCRIDTRGHVNRLLRRLRSDATLERGAVVVADGKDVGAVTTAAGNVALAMLRREVEPGSEVARAHAARVRSPRGSKRSLAPTASAVHVQAPLRDRGRRERHDEAGAAAGRRLDRRAPAHRRRELAHDREAEAGARRTGPASSRTV